ncbi:Hypothetical protein HVR_LOCUS395 [uncultured virus]|nr:Hypothetical protein HVR_LOCUS395 [uncultured virus]
MDEITKLVLERLSPETNDKIYAIYRYGSQVYRSVHLNSDHDFIVVTDDDLSIFFENSIKLDENQLHIVLETMTIDINCVTREEFQHNLDNNEIWALECVFTTPIYSRHTFNIVIDIKKLRASISRNSDQSFNKAKKKFVSPYNVEGELMRGKKSLFHAFRVLMFGIQLAKHQRIVDFQEANPYFIEIMDNPSEKWENYAYLKAKHNALMSAFRVVAPIHSRC